jgi:CDP-glucose 4,6-dehydratase
MSIRRRFLGYEGLRVLVTGHTGFKGGWLSTWLLDMGADAYGMSLPPEKDPNLFAALGLDHRMTSTFLDIRDADAVRERVRSIAPSIVFHLAAQPLVRRSYDAPLETFETNIIGTANVLEACRGTDSIRAVVCVTTDKVYDNKEWTWPYREVDRLGGRDPYSASKACAEIIAGVYQTALGRQSGALRIATARGGNVVGGGDWSDDRIVPDIVRAVETGQPIRLRHPDAVRPWQHVLELCEGYLELGLRLHSGEEGFAEAWNFGPQPVDQVTVGELVHVMLDVLGRPGHTVDIEPSLVHEARLLKLDISKSISRLAWRPRLDVRETLTWTAAWYRDQAASPKRAWDLTAQQIRAFEGLDASASLRP